MNTINKNMNEIYDNTYYECGLKTGISLYTNYRWIPEVSFPIAHTIIEKIKINENNTILDFGCAKGFLVKAFRMLNASAYGVDISQYAIENCDPYCKDYLKHINNIEEISNIFNFKFDLVIAKDVFEHIPYEAIDDTIKTLKENSKKLFVVVPLGDNNKYIIPDYELDKTHIIKENLNWWKTKFKNAGYKNIISKYYIKGIKDNWSFEKHGNGFFICQ